ncbi:unnamed protein product [Mytilus edulis]|uniref:LRAT domain-containing protein n=1 Tax=Mytilus edulis TaxID=6550 RepID=A0A8S3Q3L0_MYTED|nr:unnamed protein product [Mytilus edulis]
MQPAGAKKIANISEYIPSCNRQLTHVAVFRKLGYYHHYLVLDVGDNFVDIVHYGAIKALPVIFPQRINFDSDLLDFSSGVFVIKKQNYPSTDEENYLAYERLRSRLGETEYSASSNNCESFVTWVLTGEAECEQFEQSSPGKRSLADCIDSGLGQGTKVIRGVIKEDIETSLANVSISDSNVRCFLWASVLTAITGAKTVVKVGTSAIAAAASSNITVVVAAPIEIISCGKEIVNMYRKKQETHLSTKTFTRQVTKKSVVLSHQLSQQQVLKLLVHALVRWLSRFLYWEVSLGDLLEAP